MTSSSPTRLPWQKKQSHKLWKPHAYQEKGVEFLISNGAAALFADPGTGKTSTTLAAFEALRSAGVAKRLLVIAPRRVCQLVWWQESQEWTQFRHFRFAWLHSSRAPWDPHDSPKKKEKELVRDDADIWLINPEGLAWLSKQFTPRTFPFDTVVVDELTKIKNAQAKRSKNLRKLTVNVPRRWGLTGSPTPNGYEDLFGQILWLDGGLALGPYYSHFRDKYFIPDGFNGWAFKLAPNADRKIEQKIEHMVLRIAAEDWLDLPECVPDPIYIELDDKARKAYDKLKKDMLLETEGEQITAASAAALYSKLAQLANGRVYLEEELGKKREVVKVHDAKITALDDLVDDLGGAPLLVTYEFNHDLDQLKEWHEARFKKPLRYLGSGVTDSEVFGIEKDWNNNAIRVLAAHPASSGHGLNFQRGGASHICHFSATWDFELYDQVIQRILRQGNTAAHVVNHLLLVKDSIDELKYEALRDKDTTQDRFLHAINTAFGNETGIPAAGQAAATETKESPMAFESLKKKRLATKEQAEEASAEAPAEQAADEKPKKGWGGKAAKTEEAEQREEIQEKLTTPPDDTEAAAEAAFEEDTPAQPAEAPAASLGADPTTSTCRLKNKVALVLRCLLRRAIVGSLCRQSVLHIISSTLQTPTKLLRPGVSRPIWRWQHTPS